MTAALQTESEIFAGNRATGHIALTANAKGGRTRRTRVDEAGSLRVRFPNEPTGVLETVIINNAGGMAGGDHFEIDIALGAGAQVTAGTASAEKIYRSTGPDARLGVRLKAGPHAKLAWLPQETILFDNARLSRHIDIELDSTASLVLCEGMVFGRAAMGETVGQGCVIDRWRLRRGGKLVFAETARLDGGIDRLLAEPACANGGIALATLLIVPGEEAMTATIREMEPSFAGEVGVSVWNGIALARFCARDGAALRHDIILVLGALDLCALPRLWLS